MFIQKKIPNMKPPGLGYLIFDLSLSQIRARALSRWSFVPRRGGLPLARVGSHPHASRIGVL